MFCGDGGGMGCKWVLHGGCGCGWGLGWWRLEGNSDRGLRIVGRGFQFLGCFSGSWVSILGLWVVSVDRGFQFLDCGSWLGCFSGDE